MSVVLIVFAFALPGVPVGTSATAPPPVTAQAPAGALAGTVRDATGGTLPGVTVELVAVTTRAGRGGSAVDPPRQAVTNPAGAFRFETVSAGNYDLTAALPGFKTYRGRVQIRSGSREAVAIELEIGSLVEELTVSSGAAPTPASARQRQERVTSYMDLAKWYYQQGLLADAASATSRALELMQLETPPAATAAAPVQPVGPIRVGGSIREPRMLKGAKPIYPAEAAAAGTEGTVILEATVGRDGAVVDARVVRSVPGLDDAALAAVRQWLYTPTLLNGKPVEVRVTVTVNFVR